MSRSTISYSLSGLYFALWVTASESSRNLRRLSESGCEDSNDVLTINVGPLKEFFTQPDAWEIALIIIGGLSLLVIITLAALHCRVTCDRQSRGKQENEEKQDVDEKSFETIMSEDVEKFIPNGSFRKSRNDSAAKSLSLHSMRSNGTQRSLILTGENNMSLVVNELLEDGLPVVGIFLPEKNNQLVYPRQDEISLGTYSNTSTLTKDTSPKKNNQSFRKNSPNKAISRSTSFVRY